MATVAPDNQEIPFILEHHAWATSAPAFVLGFAAGVALDSIDPSQVSKAIAGAAAGSMLWAANRRQAATKEGTIEHHLWDAAQHALSMCIIGLAGETAVNMFVGNIFIESEMPPPVYSLF